MGRNVVPILLFLLANGQVNDKDFDFRHEYFGASFSPYTRDSWDRKSCTKEELTVMLKLLSSKGVSSPQRIRLYCISVRPGKFGSWKHYHYQCGALTAYVAAEINSQANSLLLQVNVGVDIGNTYLEKEMGNALDVAEAANNLFPGTVPSITLRVFTVPETRQRALNIIRRLQRFGQKVKESRLEFGFADNDCRTFTSSSRELLKMMDYVMCWYAAHEILPPITEVQKAFNYFIRSEEVVRGLSNVTRVVIRTGRTSLVKDDPNATAEYWRELSRLAKSNNVTVTVSFPITDPSVPEKFRRSGWWTQVKEEIQDESAFAEKRWLQPSQAKFIKKGLTDLWKAVPIHSANISFDGEKFGVLFRPANKKISDGRNYSLAEVVTMLELVATRFHYIVTYRMGPMYSYEDWSQGKVDGVSAYAASLVNKNYSERKLKVIVGVNMDTTNLELTEFRNAIQVTEVANAEFPGTVVGIQLWSFRQVFNTSLAKDLLQSKFADKARELRLPLGIRVEHCEMLDNNSKPLLGMIDFITCSEDALKGGLPKLEARRVYSYFEEAKDYIFTLSPKVEFIGMTKYLNGMSNQAGKLVEYWLEINRLVKSGHLSIIVSEAFDTLSTKSMAFRTSGWWKRVKENTGDVSAFWEKVDLEEPDDLSISSGPPEKTEVQANPIQHTGPAVEGFVERHSVSIAIAVVGGLLFICGVFATTLAYTYEKVTGNDEIKAFRLGGPLNSQHEEEYEMNALLVSYDEKFEIPERDIEIDRSALLGSGQYGKVYKGYIGIDRLPAAIKISKGSPASIAFTSCLSEIKVMIHVGTHPNVVSLIGACTKHIELGNVMVVTEFCGKGSLQEILQVRGEDFKKASINASLHSTPIMTLYVKWSHEIAKGMEHISLKNVIHADLATRNILVDSYNVAKVADFGLSRHIYQYQEYVKKGKEPLPWAWMAIESLRNLRFSTKSDVWSYGITLFEIFSLGSVPYAGLNWSDQFVDILERGLRPSKPELCTDDMFTIMRSCWETDPGLRPSFSEIARTVGDVLEKVAASSSSSTGRGYMSPPAEEGQM